MIKLGTRLQHINRVALVVAVSFVTVCIVISSFMLGLFALIDTSRVQAKVLADNTAAALVFQDVKSAGEMLQSLRNSPDVIDATLYGKDGGVFVGYTRGVAVAGASQAAGQRPAGPPEDLVVRPSHIRLS